jgi:hypothetical protein
MLDYELPFLSASNTLVVQEILAAITSFSGVTLLLSTCINISLF